MIEGHTLPQRELHTNGIATAFHLNNNTNLHVSFKLVFTRSLQHGKQTKLANKYHIQQDPYAQIISKRKEMVSCSCSRLESEVLSDSVDHEVVTLEGLIEARTAIFLIVDILF